MPHSHAPSFASTLRHILELGCGPALACMLLVATGCTRTHYRVKADQEAYCTLGQETTATPWEPEPGFTIAPDPRSRFFDPTPIDDPCLPIPSPRLNDYTLPPLPPRDPARFRKAAGPQTEVRAESAATPALTAPMTPDGAIVSLVQQISYQQPLPTPAEPAFGSGMAAAIDPRSNEVPETSSVDSMTLRVVPIPKDTWQSLPPSCLLRMFEFESIRQEYARTFGHEPSADRRDSSQRLALEDIMELALINSREYQSQKETLYQAALRLTLERFDYDMKFFATGNGTAVDYRHDRVGSATTDTLAIPSTATGGKVLATGGELLARFANDVVLTFNGPEGFAADVGSELLFDISQSVFQRDIVFEQLTQAERDLVYAARSFSRFRREFFSSLAADYYGLVLAYRGIEIDAQDFFSNLRAFHQGKAEYRYEGLPRLQVDQFEQNALASRSRLIGACNSLEDDLDQLKFRIGLPPEVPINLDLTELEELTLRDEATVASEGVRRVRENLLSNRRQAETDLGVLLNDAVDLTERLVALNEKRRRLGYAESQAEALKLLLAQLSADETRLLVEANRAFLARDLQSKPPAPPLRVFQRTRDLIDSLLKLSRQQMDLAALQAGDPAAMTAVQQNWASARARLDRIGNDLERAVADRQLDRIPELKSEAEALLATVETVARSASQLTDSGLRGPAEQNAQTKRQIDRVVDLSGRILAQHSIGLVPVELDMDEAMLTALVRRFDVMNERGALADAWRRIKLAGDDLKSVLNLNAAQRIGTRRNRPFGFTFDESQTRLSVTLDTPLNRKAQRNAFRVSLIDYQAALRNLIELEDSIKLSVRSDLRRLQLRREQYRIAVASAALASDRVGSTRLQLQLGIEGVTARDFLESQQAYTASLNAVAAEHIDYLLNRIELFLELELLEVNEEGFWPDLYNERLQPTPQLEIPEYARPAYGKLPKRVCHSKEIKRMLGVPAGHSEIHKDQATVEK